MSCVRNGSFFLVGLQFRGRLWKPPHTGRAHGVLRARTSIQVDTWSSVKLSSSWRVCQRVTALSGMGGTARMTSSCQFLIPRGHRVRVLLCHEMKSFTSSSLLPLVLCQALLWTSCLGVGEPVVPRCVRILLVKLPEFLQTAY